VEFDFGVQQRRIRRRPAIGVCQPSLKKSYACRTISTFCCDIARPSIRFALASAMASAELSRRVGKVVGDPPLCEMSDLQRREFQMALLEADDFENLPRRWQATTLKAEQGRPKLRVVSADQAPCPPFEKRGAAHLLPAGGAAGFRP
jgi:hypothetical protein